MIVVIPQNLALEIVIRDRGGIIFDGKVAAISSFNEVGPFDVLPLHANFISLIEKEIIIHFLGAQDRSITVRTGVLKVREDKAEVYLGILH